MQDYMLTNSPMSWKEAWNVYFVENGGALFEDLGRYGLKMPKYHELATAEADHVSHQIWSVFCSLGQATGFHTFLPSEEKMNWLSEKYPDTFDKYYRPRFEYWAKQKKEGTFEYQTGLPQLCQVCQIPMIFTEVQTDPMQLSFRSTRFGGDRYHFCSDGCKDVFENEPQKYTQAWLPVHQIYQGNCGGPTLPEVLKWYKFTEEDSGDYVGSRDYMRWQEWKGTGEPDKSVA
jgi:phenol hydroxylase P3 protein